MSLKNASDSVLTLPQAPVAVEEETSATGRFLKAALLFTLIGVLIYLGLYAGSEALVYHYAKRNRFFDVMTAPYNNYDYVILGASHAMALDYEDMTPRLEAMTGDHIINLSEVGAGIYLNRLFFNYFMVHHSTQAVVYVADSFAFYSPEWNEDRLNDTRLFVRAPFDPTLVGLLLQDPASRGVVPDYVMGFSKINNPDRFAPDINDDERLKFETTYHPIKQIDQQRIEYLYPKQIDPATFARYLGQFENLIQYLQAHHIRLIVVKPPIPQRFYQMLPHEAEFDQRFRALLDRYGVEFHDFSLVDNDEKYYFNSDHLNKSGVLNFFQQTFAPMLVAAHPPAGSTAK